MNQSLKKSNIINEGRIRKGGLNPPPKTPKPPIKPIALNPQKKHKNQNK